MLGGARCPGLCRKSGSHNTEEVSLLVQGSRMSGPFRSAECLGVSQIFGWFYLESFTFYGRMSGTSSDVRVHPGNLTYYFQELNPSGICARRMSGPLPAIRGLSVAPDVRVLP